MTISNIFLGQNQISLQMFTCSRNVTVLSVPECIEYAFVSCELHLLTVIADESTSPFQPIKAEDLVTAYQ